MHNIITTIAAVLLVGCATPQQPEPPTANAPDISIQHAVATGDIEAVKRHLNAGTDVNEKEKNATINWRKGTSEIVFTPLHYAASGNHKEVVELLIAEGADVNAKTDAGFTPLCDAAQFGHKEIVELLIAKGADVNAKRGAPLNAAIITKHTEIAELLRKHGAKTGEELKAEGK